MVAFDAVGPSGGAGTAFTTPSPGTWPHVNGGNGIIVGVTCLGGTANTVTGVTYGGVTIPFLGYIASGGAGVGPGGIAMYGLAGPTCPTGSNTVSVAFSDAPSNHNAGSISVSGAGSLGTPVTSFAVGPSTTVSATINGTTTGGLIVSAVCFGGNIGGGVFSATAPNVLRYSLNTSATTASDNIAGGSDPSTGGGANQTVTWTNTQGDNWGIVAVEVLPAVSAGGAWPVQRHRFRDSRSRSRRQHSWPLTQTSTVSSQFTGLLALSSVPGAQLPPVTPAASSPPRYPQHGPVSALLLSRRKQDTNFVPPEPQTPPSISRNSKRAVVQLTKRYHGQAPTGWPVPVQPPEIPISVNRYSRPPWPRRGNVVPTGWPVPQQPPFNTEWLRARFKPPWIRRGVTLTGLPVPVQPPYNPIGFRARFKPPWPRRGNVPESQLGQQVPITPSTFAPGVTFERVRRWTQRRSTTPTGLPIEPTIVGAFESPSRIWLSKLIRRGGAPTGLPVPVQPPEIPSSERRWTKPPWPRRGIVPPTGLPVPVQPPERMQAVHRWTRPLWPRRGSVQNTTPPPVSFNPPISWSEHRWSRPPYPRRGVVPPTGWPVPVQPSERMQFVRRWTKPLLPRRGITRVATPPPVSFNPPISGSERRWSRPPWPRRGVIPPTGWPVPVQPPERMQAVHRWIRPPLPRRGTTKNAIPPTVAAPLPFVPVNQRHLLKRITHFGRTVQAPGVISGPVPSATRPGRYRKIIRVRNAEPGTPFLPPPQIPFNPTSVRRRLRPPLPRKGFAKPGSGLPIKVQPPERMQSIRRWIRSLLPRRGVTRTRVPPFTPPAVIEPSWVWIEISIPATAVSFVELPFGSLVLVIPNAIVTTDAPYVSIDVVIPPEEEF